MKQLESGLHNASRLQFYTFLQVICTSVICLSLFAETKQLLPLLSNSLIETYGNYLHQEIYKVCTRFTGAFMLLVTLHS